MATLDNNTLTALEKAILDFKRNPKTVPYGYPVSLITNLLDTIREQKSLKKKYQRLAEMRGKYLMEIFSTASKAVDRTTEALEE